MKILDYEDNEISTLEEWKSHVKAGQWKKGRSAYALADYMMNKGGAEDLESDIGSVLPQFPKVAFERATPEYQAKFDCYRGPSNLDLGLYGRVCSGKRMFVGLEAKVDEAFGKTVGERYRKAKKDRCDGKPTNAPERVEELLSKYFLDTDLPGESKFSCIRYQLLTATAGIVAVTKRKEIDIAVFCVLVFRTCAYEKGKGDKNYKDYEKFVKCVRGEQKPSCGSQIALAHKLCIGGKELFSIYKYVDVH